MALDETIIIPVEIDVTGGIRNLGTLSSQGGKSIEVLGNQVDRLRRLVALPNLNTQQYDRLNAMLLKSHVAFMNAREAASRMPAAMNTLTTSTNQSTNALINMGRVVQDAPYGFIGIANNINPLVESFQRLKASTGSTGGAFKSLIGSLRGAGGVGLAFSVVSAALVMFSGRMFGASRATKEANDRLKELGSELAGQLVKLTTMVGVINNVNTSYADKKNALAAINQEYGTYIKNLALEEVSLSNVSAAYDKIIDSMIRQAVVKGIQEEITKQVEATAKSLVGLGMEQQRYIQSLQKQTTVQTQAKDSMAIASENYEMAGKALNRYNNTVRDGMQAQMGINREQLASVQQSKDYEAMMESIKSKLKESIAPALALAQSFADLGVGMGKLSDKGLDDLLRKAKEVQKFFEVPFSIKFSEFDTKPDELNKARETLARYFAGQLRLKIPVQAELDLTPPEDPSLRPIMWKRLGGLEEGIDIGVVDVRVKPNYEMPANTGIVKMQENLNKLFGPKKAPVLNLRGDISEEWKKYEKAVQDFNIELGISSVLAESMANQFGSFFDAIAQGENAFASFGELVKGVLKGIITELGRAIVMAAILSALSGGKTTFAKAFGQSLGFRRRGGPIQAGKPYVVGEDGPEVITPTASGYVLPANSPITRQYIRMTGQVPEGLNTGNVFTSPQSQSIPETFVRNTTTNGRDVMKEMSVDIKNIPEVLRMVVEDSKLPGIGNFSETIISNVTTNGTDVMESIRNFFNNINVGVNAKDRFSQNMESVNMNVHVPKSVQLHMSGRDMVGVLALETASQRRNF